MSTSIALTLFKGCSLQELQNAIEATMAEFGGHAVWHATEGEGIQLLIHSKDDMHSVDLLYRGGIFGFFKPVALRLQCPWMEARVQCSNHWDYSLMHGDRDLHDFSTHPQFFSGNDPEAIRKSQGSPDELARVWGVPRERIERYIMQWGDKGSEIGEGPIPNMKTIVVKPEIGTVEIIDGVVKSRFLLQGKAYPDDEFEYGDCWQLYDFIRALGGDDPRKGNAHLLAFPDNHDIYSVFESRPAHPQQSFLTTWVENATAWITERIGQGKRR